MSNFRRRLMCKKTESDLPSGYTRLNYLESTGTQYIDMGVTPYEIKDMQLIFDYQITDDFKKKFRLFGAYNNDEKYLQLFHNPDIAKLGFHCGRGISSLYNPLIIKDNLRHKINVDLFNSTMTIDKSQYNISIEKGNTTHLLNIYLFCRNTKNIADWFSSAKIYSFIIQNKNEIYRNFIPALDKNNQPCLYDTVSKKPFYNKGTDKFLYG